MGTSNSVDLPQALNAMPSKKWLAWCCKLCPKHWKLPSLEFCKAPLETRLVCSCCNRKLLCRSAWDRRACARCNPSKASERRPSLELVAWSIAPWTAFYEQWGSKKWCTQSRWPGHIFPCQCDFYNINDVILRALICACVDVITFLMASMLR